MRLSGQANFDWPPGRSRAIAVRSNRECVRHAGSTARRISNPQGQSMARRRRFCSDLDRFRCECHRSVASSPIETGDRRRRLETGRGLCRLGAELLRLMPDGERHAEAGIARRTLLLRGRTWPASRRRCAIRMLVRVVLGDRISIVAVRAARDHGEQSHESAEADLHLQPCRKKDSRQDRKHEEFSREVRHQFHHTGNDAEREVVRAADGVSLMAG